MQILKINGCQFTVYNHNVSTDTLIFQKIFKKVISHFPSSSFLITENKIQLLILFTQGPLIYRCFSRLASKKMRLWHRCFPVNFAKLLRTPFLTEHLRWLLLFFLFSFSVINVTNLVITSIYLEGIKFRGHLIS